MNLDLERFRELNKYYFAQMLSSCEVSRFVSSALAINPNPRFAYQNYFGFNFQNDQLKNIKIYFSFYEKLPLASVQKLIPQTVDYQRCIGFWRPTGERTLADTGCSFAVKIDRQLNCTYQFHFRHKPIVIPDSLRIGSLSAGDMGFNAGTSYEYTPSLGASATQKKYFYFLNSPIAMKCLERFGVQPFPNHMLEYTETQKSTKVIHWLSDQLYYNQLIEEIEGWPNYKKFIKDFELATGLKPQYPGQYLEENQRAIYFLADLPKEEYARGHSRYLENIFDSDGMLRHSAKEQIPSVHAHDLNH